MSFPLGCSAATSFDCMNAYPDAPRRQVVEHPAGSGAMDGAIGARTVRRVLTTGHDPMAFLGAYIPEEAHTWFRCVMS